MNHDTPDAPVAVAPLAIILLETPIARGEGEVTTLTIRQIHGRDCAGLSLARLAIGNVDELRQLLPRVTDLLEIEVDCMDAADLVDVVADLGELVQPSGDVTMPTLRRPLGGDLRNVSMARLQLLYYDELRTIIPRIATPALTAEAIDAMPLGAVIALADKASDFLLSRRRRAELLTA